MKIQSINPNYNRINNPSFNSNFRTVLNDNGKMLYRTTTYFYRDDLDWQRFANLLASKYKNTSKVHVIDHACSNGVEAITLLMMFKTKFKHKAKKFFPIIARDINHENIKMAKKNEPIDITSFDEFCIKRHTKNNFYEFLEEVNINNYHTGSTVRLKDNHRKNIKYGQGDIFKDIKHIPSKNTVLMARNFWPYLTEEKRRELVKAIAEKLDHTSLLVIGGYDKEESNISLHLTDSGFFPTNVDYVYQKLAPIKFKPVYRLIFRFLRMLCNNSDKQEQPQKLDNRNLLA